MNKLKVNSKIQIILAAILVIGIGIIAINIISNNKAMAGAPSSCPNCGGSISTVTRNPTCTQAGKYIYSCPICQADVGEDPIPALGHSYGPLIETTPATCTNTGVKTATCSRCGKTTTSVIPVIGHSYTNVPNKDGTHTPTCTMCSKKLSAVNCSYGNWITAKSATCEEDGSKVRECMQCGYADTIPIPAAGHSYTNASNNNGTHTPTCTRCSKVFSPENCSYGDEKIVKPTTCTEDGLASQTCTACGYVNYITYEATGHVKGEWKTEIEPTCEEDGSEVKKCLECGETLETRKVAALGHSYTGEGRINQPATCTKNEIRQYECVRCKNSYEYREVPDTATGHRFSNNTDTVPGTFINATCEKGAQAKLYCQYCREPSADWYVVSNPVPHSYEVVNTASTSICMMCKNCGATTGHNYEPTRIEPTCYKDGATMDKCTNAGCTSEINKVILPATGKHDMYNDGVVQKAKCNVNRIDRWICRNEGCTYSYEKPVDGTALTHNFQKLIQEIPSTCYEKGKQIKQCVNEGCTETEESEVPWSELKPHKYVALNDGSGNCSVCSNEGCTSKISHNMVTDKEDATCLKEGHNKVYCSNAGCTKIEKDEIYPKTAHEKDDATKTFSSHPTCEHGTQYRYFCKYCGTAIWLYDSDKIDHNFVNGECTVCHCKEADQTVQGVTQFNINGTTVANIQLDTSADKFATSIRNQNENAQVKLYNANNESIEDDEKLATGMKMEVAKEEGTYIITLVLKGDVNGDGEVGMADMLKTNKYRLSKVQLGVPYIQAADVFKDEIVDFMDLIKLNKFRLNKITEL